MHDAAEGGIAVALAECAVTSAAGAELDLPADAVTRYGEGGGQAVLACGGSDRGRVEELAAELVVPLRSVGEVGGDRLLDIPLDALREAYAAALPTRLDR